MTLFQLLTEGTRDLKLAGDPDAEIDAKELLIAAFQLDLMKYLMTRMQPIEEKDETEQAMVRYRQMIKKRCRRFPLQQILNYQDFMGLSFFINEHVLIPRQDTETLVELVLEEQTKRDIRIYDLCTGSGCIAISLKKKGCYQSVTASDLSMDALAVAKKNNDKICDGQVTLLQGDLFTALEQVPEEERKFDVIISNPPYIPSAVIETLQPEVKDHEPRMALDGEWDGLSFYRVIAKESKHYLKNGGILYLEIGHDQGKSVPQLLEEEGYQNVKVVKDLCGNDRVVTAGV